MPTVGEWKVYGSKVRAVNVTTAYLIWNQDPAVPELPEVETVCRTLRRPLIGREISDARVLWHRTVEPMPVDEFVERVSGNSLDRVFRRAKLIVFGFSNGDFLTTHLRMTGKLLYRPNAITPGNEPKSHLRVSFTLDNEANLDFYDARKFGRIQYLNARQWSERSASYGPEPLEPEFTADTFHQRLHQVNRQIKPLLLDQSFLAGVGNIYADEALYQARIHPQKISSSISRPKTRALHEALIEILESAIENSGTTFRDYRSGLGESGSNQTRLVVYGAESGTPCVRCGTTLRKLVVGQRGTTICPRCQRLR